jgi:hypothetical protein
VFDLLFEFDLDLLFEFDLFEVIFEFELVLEFVTFFVFEFELDLTLDWVFDLVFDLVFDAVIFFVVGVGAFLTTFFGVGVAETSIPAVFALSATVPKLTAKKTSEIINNTAF